MAARGEVVLAFVGADGEFLFAAVEGEFAAARYGEDVREADAVFVVGFLAIARVWLPLPLASSGISSAGMRATRPSLLMATDVRFAVRQGLQGDGAACATGGDEGFAAFGFAVSSAPGMRKP